MSEKWKPILGYEASYSVSNLGAVARTRTYGKKPRKVWKPLAPRKKKHGYIAFHLCQDGIRKDPLAHRMVWEAFKGPIPPLMEINHLNGNKTDNRLCNLELLTRSANLQHSFRVLKRPAPNNPSFGVKNGASKLTEDDVRKIRSLYQTGKYRQVDIGKKFGVSQRMISLITRNEKWRHVTAAIP